MTKVKQTSDQYDALRSDMKSKTSEFAKEAANKKQSVLDALSWVEEVDKIKELWHKAKVKLAQEFREKNKDLIAEYKKLWAEHRKNEKVFQELFAKAKEELNEDIDEASLREVIMWKSEKSESKEIATKSLEFEKDTFKISSEWWEEVTKETAKKNPVLQKFLDKGIKVKANATWDVVEYMEDTVNWELLCKKWEQIFIDYDKFVDYVALDKQCSREEVEKRYLMTRDELKEKMKDKPSGSEEYKKFFNEEVNGHLAGFWNSYNEGFSNVGERSNIWLAGGNNASFNQYRWNCNYCRHFGWGGRLLKN